MKKLVALLTLCALLTVPALAEIDLSGMSFDELLALKEQVNRALWDSEEWQEVVVPAGAYTVGKEIPAGYWTIAPVASGMGMVDITWGKNFDESGTRVEFMSMFTTAMLLSESLQSSVNMNSVSSVSWDLIEGTVLTIANGSVTFTPFTGNEFGFK